MLLLSVAYGVYLYTFAKKQVETIASTDTSVASAKLTAYASPEKIQEYFQIYKDRQGRYTEVINGLIVGNVVEVKASTSSVPVVATTTNQ